MDGTFPYLFNQGLEGGFELILTQSPIVTINAPASGATFTEGTPINIDVTAQDPDGSVVRLEAYGPTGRIAILTQPRFAFLWTNAPAGNHYLNFFATDNLGAWGSAYISVFVRPRYDDFANATAITGTDYSQTNLNVSFATRESGEPRHAGGAGSYSVWWAWAAPSNGTYRVTLSTSFSSSVAVYTGSNLTNLTQVAANSFVSALDFAAIGGSTYHIAVAGYYSNSSGTIYSFGLSVPPSVMALIPAGSFTMGDSFSEGNSDELPTHSVDVSAFYMDRTEVTKALWDEVYQWGVTNGYSFEFGAAGKGASHPAQKMTWYDAVKWCNARSEKAGRVPAYYTDAGLTQRYRSGQVSPYVDWSTGYRLPTEAEWEKAARGGANGRRFPWGDTISQGQANYYAVPAPGGYSYDLSPLGYHPTFAVGGWPYTSPVGSFAANGYGLYDMAGNVVEWCWDWYGSSYYGSSPSSDPRGSVPGSYRVIRGGGWMFLAYSCRSAFRSYNNPDGRDNDIGFRSALPPSQ